MSQSEIVKDVVLRSLGFQWWLAQDIKSTDERSPWGLISLLSAAQWSCPEECEYVLRKALQADTSSQLYQSPTS